MQIDVDEFLKLVSKGGRLQKESPMLASIFKAKAEKKKKAKRKPSKYNLFVKAKSKGQKFKYQSGPDKGKLNMRKIGIAWRKKKR